jgi:hypothetical protein
MMMHSAGLVYCRSKELIMYLQLVSRITILSLLLACNKIHLKHVWQKTHIEVICCYVSHNPTVLSPLSRLRCDNQQLVYSLVNSSCLFVLSRKFISRITLTFRFNLTSHAKYIVLCGVSHLVTMPPPPVRGHYQIAASGRDP